jgi:signal transduction histidine kinase
MSRLEDLRELSGELRRYSAVSEGLLDALSTLVEHDIPNMGKGTTTALAAAGLLENFYTATETVLFRIAQNFGNNLDPERWHSDLLRRMLVDIPSVRPAVLSDQSYAMLEELMRFRHFKRYYFQLEFDWHRLEYLMELIPRLEPLLREELRQFEGYVSAVIAELEGR